MNSLTDDDAVSVDILRRVGSIIAYLLLGVVGTAGTALVLLNITQPAQSVIYNAVYPQVGPSDATQTAILTHFIVVSVVAITLPTLLGDYLTDRLENRVALTKGIGAMLLLVLVFLAVSLGGLAAFLTAIIVLGVALVGVPVMLWYRYGVRSGGIPAFVGGIPVLVLLLLLVGFGLGWGWGYVVTAQETSPSSVNGTVANFDEVPEVRDDLFAPGNCEVGSDDRRVCYLELRGYEHEVVAARFLARQGVRCPYQNTRVPQSNESFIAQHDGTYYRVSCSPHGD